VQARRRLHTADQRIGIGVAQSADPSSEHPRAERLRKRREHEQGENGQDRDVRGALASADEAITMTTGDHGSPP
jgi:hypothetical protein